MMLGLFKYKINVPPHFAKNTMLLVGIGFILKQEVEKDHLLCLRPFIMLTTQYK